MDNNQLIKQENNLLQKVGNAISVTNKLLALAEPQLIPYRKGDKWGYCTQDKKIMIDCIWDKVGFFSEGISYVVNQNKYSYIDTNGCLITPISFDYGSSFQNGIADVRIEDKHLMLNKFGSIPTRQELEIARVKKKKLTDSLKDSLKIRKNEETGKSGFWNSNNEIIIPLVYDDVNAFRNNIAAVCLNGKWGFINSLGKTVIQFIYDNAGYFGWELSIANVQKDCFYGFIDTNDKTIIPFIYSEAKPFHQSLAAVKQNKKWGFINSNADTIIDFKYSSAHSFSGKGIAMIKTFEGNYGYINREGVEYWED